MPTRGFSLVELSIVLVILGLLTGGILAGQSLIRASELRSVSTEYNRYVTAMQTFRDKYFALPGDMTNATKFWGTSASCPGDNTTVTAPAITTCNGDGNGQLSSYATTSNETYRMWQHLADAGLIEGSFTGVTATNNAVLTVNSTSSPNVPASKLSNAVWWSQYVSNASVSDITYFDGAYGNSFYFSTGPYGTFGILKPEEAWNIDTKMDDGKPGTGKIRSLKDSTQANATTGCSDVAYTVATSIASSSNYLLTNSSKACSLIFSGNV